MCKTIKLKVKFQANPLRVYELLTNEKKFRSFSGKKASIKEKVGSSFSNYDEHVSGIMVDLSPGERVVQAWRHRKFPKGIFSMASFNLVSTHKGGTELTLTHRGVPKELIPKICEDWRNLYWDKMKKYLDTQYVT